MSSSRRTSVEGAAVEKTSPSREDASPSAAEASPASALRPDGQPSTSGSNVAPDAAGTREQLPGPQLSTSAASERSIELTAGPSSSLAYVQSGLLSPSKGTSRSRADLVTEASQTLDDSTVDGVYRSLTLQFSPSRRSQQDSWSRPTSPGGSQAPLSPKSPSSPCIGTPSVAAAVASRVWSSFTRPQEATDDVQTKLAHSEELFKGAAGAATAEKARSMTAQASSGRQDQALLSPRTTAGWVGLPWNLGVTEETFKRTSRSKSPTAVDSQIAAALSAEAAEFDDTLAVPRVPWATLAVIWLAAQAHWKFLHKHYPERCASAVAIVHEGHWSRAVFAAFHHVDFSHLTSNLVRFFFKGIVLEAALGTTHFAAIFAIAVFAVGLVNTALIEIAYLVTRSSYLHTMCAHTFSGVVVALQVFGFSHYWEATVHYGKYEHSVGTHMLSLLFADLGFLWLSLKREWLSMAIGLVIGCIMVAVMRVPYRRRHLYLVAAPKTPVTYALMCAVVSAYLYGPYAEPSALDKATLTFRVPPWRPFMLSPLYVANVYLLAYALLTLFTVGQRLERNLGAFRLLLLAPALLFAVSVLRDGLRFVLWKYQLAIWSTMPPPTPHSGDCCCGLVGTLLALKAVYLRHPPGRCLPARYRLHSSEFLAGPAARADTAPIVCARGLRYRSRDWSPSGSRGVSSAARSTLARPAGFGRDCQLLVRWKLSRLPGNACTRFRLTCVMYGDKNTDDYGETTRCTNQK
ncbi:hypothetical protein HPB50_003856 [Hyalomma asiaticum]|uniref:Uncharacterized protein n=1 Tax=Hyalomma asiaticum TaxID=266040 RepID=A0ACB7RHH9_HYAAI|nr:hypothetical protein HPB50_003856 [Hyalomma asiaticum]